jgi:hypothetical protein
MAIEVIWDDADQTALYLHASGAWDWQDFYSKTDELFTLVKTAARDIDVVIDLSTSNTLPGNALSHFQTVMRRTPANVRSYIFVGVSGFHEAVLSVLRHIVSERVADRFIFTEDLAAAHQILVNIRQIETIS